MIQQQHKAAQQQQQQQQQLLLTMASGLLLLIFSALFISAETKVASYDHVAPGLGFTSVMLVEKVPFWNAAGMLLTPLKVTVNCSSSAVSVVCVWGGLIHLVSHIYHAPVPLCVRVLSTRQHPT